MSKNGSVTHWIEEIKKGNRTAAQELWERYFAQLVRHARVRLKTSSRRVTDEEDLALSVLDRFVRAAEDGRYPSLSDRSGLWRLLVKMTARKLIDRHRYENRQRRSAERVTYQVDGLAHGTTSPEFAVIMADEVQRLIDCLQEEKLQQLAIGKLEGYTNEEMADQLDCSVRTVERMMARIRKSYSLLFDNDQDMKSNPDSPKGDL